MAGTLCRPLGIGSPETLVGSGGTLADFILISRAESADDSAYDPANTISWDGLHKQGETEWQLGAT